MTTLLCNILPTISLQSRLKFHRYRIPPFDEERFHKYLGYERIQRIDGKKVIGVTDIDKKIDNFFNEIVMLLYKIKPKVIGNSESKEICKELDKVIQKINQFDLKSDDFDIDIKSHLLWITDNLLASFFDRDVDRLEQLIEQKDKPISESLKEIFKNKIRSFRMPDFLKPDEQRNREYIRREISGKINWLERNQHKTTSKQFEDIRISLIVDLGALKAMIPSYESKYHKKYQGFYKEMRKKIKLAKDQRKKGRGRPPKRFNVLIFHLGNKFTLTRYNKKGKPVGWARRDWELICFVLLCVHFRLHKIPEISTFLKKHSKESEEEIWKRFKERVKKEYNNFHRSSKGKFGRNFHSYQKARRFDLYQGLEPWLNYPK